MQKSVRRFLVAGLWLISCGSLAAAEPNSRPNFVIILADDLGYADIGCFGSKDIPTPNIDSLARDGVRCTNAYVTAGSCSPSRAGLMTGRYQERDGFEFNCNYATALQNLPVVGLDPAATTLANVLKSRGYATGMVGKWHLGFDTTHHPTVRGFDEYFGFLSGAHAYLRDDAPAVRAVATDEARSTDKIQRDVADVREDEYLTDAFAREACAFIDRSAGKPFFLYLPFNAVHTPFETTDKYAQRFAHVGDVKRRVYYAMTSALDDAVGRVLASLKQHGLEENTLVVFLSDNGGPTYTGVQSNGPLKAGKLTLFEGGVRVPMLVRWPTKVPAGQVRDGIVSSLDLLPTIATAAGAAVPSGLDGVDALPWLAGQASQSPHDVLYWRNGPNRAIRNGNWKLVQSGDYAWLHDLATDVGESRNLADQHPDIVRDLQQRLDAWEKELKPAAWPSRPGKPVDIDGRPYEIHI